jgi:hypothetical protein
MHFTTLSGIGKLRVGGNVVADGVPYRVDISREIRGGVPGLWRIAGEVDAPHQVLMQLMIDAPADLELELSDGQRWGCLLQNSNGRLLNSGRHNLKVPA